MATQQEINNQREPRTGARGFVTFAGVLMILVGFFQAFQGLAALLGGNFFVVGVNYIYSIDVTTWGWVHLILGIIVALAGFSVFPGRLWARVVGITLAVISAIVNFFFIPYYPFWSILIIAFDIGIIWALAVFGPREASSHY